MNNFYVYYIKHFIERENKDENTTNKTNCMHRLSRWKQNTRSNHFSFSHFEASVFWMNDLINLKEED